MTTSPATTKAAFVSQVMRELNTRKLNKLSGSARLSEVLRRIQVIREYGVVTPHQAMVANAVAWSVQSLRLSQEAEQALLAMDTRQIVSLVYDLSKTCSTQIDVTRCLNEVYKQQCIAA